MEYEHFKAPEGIAGASGVVRSRDELLVVSDDSPGCYFRVAIRDDGPLIKIPADAAKRCELSPKIPEAARLALDLESIGVLADGRTVVLSERLRCLVDEEGIVAQYDDPFSEFAEKGLEGLAVRELDNEASRIAVLWEGGYLDPSELPVQLRGALGGHVLNPAICIHDLAAGDRMAKIRMESASQVIPLLVPAPPQAKKPAPEKKPGGEKAAPRPARQDKRAGFIPPFRFRAPDLVWHEWTHESGKKEWGFIVLLNSETPPYIAPDDPKKKMRKRYGPRWLQRFDLKGRPVGNHIDLDEAVKSAIKSDVLNDANWEGLGWFEPGKRLVLVHDESKVKLNVPAAVVISIPDAWRK